MRSRQRALSFCPTLFARPKAYRPRSAFLSCGWLSFPATPIVNDRKPLAARLSAGYAARMENERLLATLTQLRAALARAEGVDPETLTRLDQLIDDAKRGAIPEERSEGAGDDQDSGGLRDMLLKFEADHPQLSTSIGRVADALAAMGF
jgi:hypothetical protein